MHTGQFERRKVMIECGGLPALRRMTLSAIRAQRTVVRVVGSVTGETILWRAFIDATDMAGTALNVRVQAYQWEGCLIVIESYILPAACVMT